MMRLPWFLLSVFSLLSCGPSRLECLDAGDCSADEGSQVACVANRCEDVECLSSLDCPIGTSCDVEDDYDCVPSCEDSDDCLAGDYCNDGSCTPYGCRSTILDCDFGQVCDPDAQQCVDPQEPHCLACDAGSNEFDQNGTPGVCDDTFTGSNECGGSETLCANYEDGGHCAIGCVDNGDCPAGYACSPLLFDLSGAGCTQDELPAGSFCLTVTCDP